MGDLGCSPACLAAGEDAPGARLRALREQGWACLEAGDADGALRAAALMLRLEPGHRDALLLEAQAHQARLAGVRPKPPARPRPPSGLLAQVEREATPPPPGHVLLPGQAKRPPGDPPLPTPAEATDLRTRLGQPVAIGFRETPLAEAVQRVATLTGVPIALEASAAASATPITLPRTHMPLESLLRWIARFGGIQCVIRGDSVVLTSRQGAGGGVVCRDYDLCDLATPPKEQPGAAGKAPGAGPDVIAEGWVRYIRATIAPDTWGEPAEGRVLQEAGKGAIAYRGGRLVVLHNPDVQDQVAELLDMFRKQRTLQVHIQARFLTVSKAYLDAMGVELAYDSFKGPGDTARTIFSLVHDTQVGGLARFTNLTTAGGLALTCRILNDHSLSIFLKGMLKEQQGVTLTAPRLTCLNAQRANLQVLINHNYIRRVTGDEIPEIGNIPEGTIFDVQPFVSADRRYITLILQPQMRELLSLVDYVFLTRATTGTGTATVLAPSGVTIQIPTTRLRSMGTTVTVPNGGTLLVAGLAEVEDYAGVATIPWVSGVPLLREVLRRYDRIEGRRSLIALVTAQTVPDIFED